LDLSTNTFFDLVRNNSNTSNPRVTYDRLAQRFFITMINVTTPNRILIAVSSGSTITATSTFTLYQFQQDFGQTNSDTGGIADYPSLGVDNNALYIGANIINGAGTAFIGSTGFVIPKSPLLTGSTATIFAFRKLFDPAIVPPTAG